MKKPREADTPEHPSTSTSNAVDFDKRLKGFRRAAKRVRAAAKKAMKNHDSTNDTTRESIVGKLDEAIDIFVVLLPRLEKLAQSR